MVFLQSNQMDTKTMNTAFLLAALLPALFVISTAIPSETEKVLLACEAGNFTAGTNASVTCYFSKNITKSVHHVYVSFYPSNATVDSEHPSTNQQPITNDTKRIEVLVCFRIHGKLQCKEKEGYHFNKEDMNTLSFVISHTTPAHAGHYSCQLVPPDDRPSDVCYLHVESKATSESSPSETTTSDSEPGKPDQGSSTITVLGIIIGIFILAGVAVGILFIRYSTHCKDFRRKIKSTKSDTCRQQPKENLKDIEENVNQSIPLVETPNKTSPVVAETVNLIFEFNVWADGLHPEANKALLDNGFDNLQALTLVEEEDIKHFQLKRGHEKILREKLKLVNEQNWMPQTGGLQVNIDSEGNVESTQPPPTVSVAEKEMVASEKEGGERTLPERQVQDSAKIVPSSPRSSQAPLENHTPAKTCAPTTTTNTAMSSGNKDMVSNVYIQGIVSISRDDEEWIILKLMDGSNLRLESTNAVKITYLTASGKSETFMRDHLSAENRDLLTKKLLEFELSEFLRPSCVTTPGKSGKVQTDELPANRLVRDEELGRENKKKPQANSFEDDCGEDDKSSTTKASEDEETQM